jgi:hypothetical protein
MSIIVPTVRFSVKEKMRKRFQKCRLACVRLRYLVLFNLWNGRPWTTIRSIVAK